jgi:NAD(P)-dependent dehydrogenase (short-subunit alcohol dehydrogenase family)
MKLANKTIVVTGGGNGIGRELVLALLQKGADVAAVDLSEKGLQETAVLAGNLREKLSTHVVNITDRAAVESLPAAVIASHGKVDGLINDAGIIQAFIRFKDMTYADIDRVMKVNFEGMINMTHTFLPFLLERPEAHIVNVSSMGGFLPVPAQTIYGASKAAVKLFTEGLHAELLDTHVGVTVVFPGGVGTNIAVNSGVFTEAQQEQAKETSTYKTTPPALAAQLILQGIEREQYRVLIGRDAGSMDLLYRLNPEKAAHIIYQRMKPILPK